MKIWAMIAFMIAGMLDTGAGTYSDDFRELHKTLGRGSATIRLHEIDWKAVGNELMPMVEEAESDEQFGRICQKLVARLQDSHAALISGTSEAPQIELPKWDAGFACLKDQDGHAVVYYVVDGSPADREGIKPGMAVVEINGVKVEKALEKARHVFWRIHGRGIRPENHLHTAQRAL